MRKKGRVGGTEKGEERRKKGKRERRGRER